MRANIPIKYVSTTQEARLKGELKVKISNASKWLIFTRGYSINNNNLALIEPLYIRPS